MYSRIKKVESVEELKKVGWDWLLESYNWDELAGNYYELDEEVDNVDVAKTETVPLVVVVHDRLSVEKAEAVVDKQGRYWISFEELEKHV